MVIKHHKLEITRHVKLLKHSCLNTVFCLLAKSVIIFLSNFKILPCTIFKRPLLEARKVQKIRRMMVFCWRDEKWKLCWLIAQRERVKIRLSGENTGDACVLSVGTADGLTLLRLQRTQDWMCICAPQQWDWTPLSRHSFWDTDT